KPQNRRSPDRIVTGHSTAIDEMIPVEHSSWVAVRCYESRDGVPGQAPAARPATETDGARFFYAHTAPVHYEIDGPVRPREKEVKYFTKRMELEIARNRGVLSADEVAEYEKALALYREIDRRSRP